MKIIRILAQIALLYVFYMAGDYLQKLLHLPIPGSIVGLLLLFVLLLCKVIPVRFIDYGASAILSYLPLFFIPATAGIVNHMDIFSGRGVLLILVLVVSTALTIGVAAHSSQWLAALSSRRNGRDLRCRSLREKGKEL
ncbi:CidA/LrgA family holin-like protein [Paenibacillus albidus]|uniref:CidA/LrgA family holin-like protein n=1 Tax=Paenibacillus albidus TaxID=2041023 RepID=UPI001BE9B4B4|nr:CidA/LrgA family holin-like protein [Paenibacillus albidus]MBT2291159.1 CidA/LrgA family holin-like protein [Paenibacillus albidus]